MAQRERVNGREVGFAFGRIMTLVSPMLVYGEDCGFGGLIFGARGATGLAAQMLAGLLFARLTPESRR
jgi:hypothetical protein